MQISMTKYGPYSRPDPRSPAFTGAKVQLGALHPRGSRPSQPWRSHRRSRLAFAGWPPVAEHSASRSAVHSGFQHRKAPRAGWAYLARCLSYFP